MALNKEYFDAINIDVVKKKYYNANKVNAVLEDIRTQAEAMCSENVSMKAQLEAINGRKSEISDAVLSAQGIYREIVEKAALRAEAIIKDAERKAAEKLREAEKKSAELAEQAQLQQEHSVKHAEALFDKLRRQLRRSRLLGRKHFRFHRTPPFRILTIVAQLHRKCYRKIRSFD